MEVKSIIVTNGKPRLVDAREAPEGDLGRHLVETGGVYPLPGADRVAFFGKVRMGEGIVVTPAHAHAAADLAAEGYRFLVMGKDGPCGVDAVRVTDTMDARSLGGVFGDVTPPTGPAQAVAAAMVLAADRYQPVAVVADEGANPTHSVGVLGMARYLRAFCDPLQDTWAREVAFGSHGLYPNPLTIPLRAPHYTVSAAAMWGSEKTACAGEYDLAVGGVLMLDEADRFRSDVLRPFGEAKARSRKSPRFIVASGTGQRLDEVSEVLGAAPIIDWRKLVMTGMKPISEEALLQTIRVLRQRGGPTHSFRALLNRVIDMGWGGEVLVSAGEGVVR